MCNRKKNSLPAKFEAYMVYGICPLRRFFGTNAHDKCTETLIHLLKFYLCYIRLNMWHLHAQLFFLFALYECKRKYIGTRKTVLTKIQSNFLSTTLRWFLLSFYCYFFHLFDCKVKSKPQKYTFTICFFVRVLFNRFEIFVALSETKSTVQL